MNSVDAKTHETERNQIKGTGRSRSNSAQIWQGGGMEAGRIWGGGILVGALLCIGGIVSTFKSGSEKKVLTRPSETRRRRRRHAGKHGQQGMALILAQK